MIKVVGLFLFCIILSLFSATCAENLSGGVTNFTDYLEKVNLTESQRKKIEAIRKEERSVLEPLALDLASKERGVELLNSMKCKTFDSNCRKLLKEDIEKREFERREALYKIQQKKAYYKIRYRNVLTRAQDIQIEEMINNSKHIEKVLKEREQRQEKQEKIDKLKFWNKLKK
ncbi:MAG: hypothetical protein LUE64_05275 [Candidatus Gastranaerophilales bacterium]|nr:hypothetical protein [Candidatus Gastranaerophilales bacterium]